MNVITRILIIDGLMLPSGFVAKSPAKCVIYCRMPADWLDGEKLKWEKHDPFFEELYGKTWQLGNEDGSRYVVEGVASQIVSPEEDSPWLRAFNDKDYNFWFYVVTDNGELQKVAAADL